MDNRGNELLARVLEQATWAANNIGGLSDYQRGMYHGEITVAEAHLGADAKAAQQLRQAINAMKRWPQ